MTTVASTELSKSARNLCSFSRIVCSARLISVTSCTRLNWQGSASISMREALIRHSRNSPAALRSVHGKPLTLPSRASRACSSTRWAGSAQSPSALAVLPSICSRVRPASSSAAAFTSMKTPSEMRVITW